MRYTTINIHGNLISEEILQKIEQAQADGQLAKDFGLEPGANLRSEIEYAWSRIKLDWQHFQERSQNLPASDPYGTSLTRRWMSGFFMALNFEISAQRTSLTGGNNQNYAISHTAANLDGLPMHIVGFYDPGHPEKNTLDIKSSGGTSRLSPHSTVQEYLNVTEHLYGLATNGLSLRLMRDSGRLVKLTYIECDLKRLLEEDKYSEFTLLYRLLHATRFPRSKGETEKCLLEKYYQDSIESGNRIRDGLSRAVRESLLALGIGFLHHPANHPLRAKLQAGQMAPQDFYRQLWRLIYRLLFLMVIEERDLVYDPEDRSEAIARKKRIYWQYYSLARLRKISRNRALFQEDFTDLWQGLLATFRLFEEAGAGPSLGIQPLDGELFNSQTLADLQNCLINNKLLLESIRNLNEFTDEQHNLVPINYRALDVEELGSVYEGLLDLHPVIQGLAPAGEVIQPRQIDFTFHEGTERKTTGSYYTRPDLVNELIKSALIPVIEDRLKAATTAAKSSAAIQEARIQALLQLKVCDPAAGSGHILLAAARTIAWYLARIRSGEENPAPAIFRTALREVIQHCIYAVDLNPDAVELCKLALWLEGHNSGKPLTFLNHKIRCGNSLVGVTDLKVLKAGIPDGAFNPVTGDDKDVCRELKQANARYQKTRQITLDFEQTTPAAGQPFAMLYHRLEQIPQDDLTAVNRVRENYEHYRANPHWYKDWTACNLWTAAFFFPYQPVHKAAAPTSERLINFMESLGTAYGPMIGQANTLSIAHKFFHWPLEFPDVFAQGGFDVMLGNPPWERIKLQQQEFFAIRDTAIANAVNAAARNRMINALPQSNPVLFAEYTYAMHTADATGKFLRDSSRCQLTAVGDINTYSIFAELFSALINPSGRSGFIVPTGIATDDSNKAFFGAMVEQNRLVSLFDFENREKIFKDVDSRYKFSLLTLAGRDLGKVQARFAFFLTRTGQLQDHLRVFSLSKADFLRLNPNTKTCPVFRTRIDAELTTKIYQRVPVLINETTGENPWGVKFATMFHMSNDSHLFRPRPQLEAEGFQLWGNRMKRGEEIWLPLYEAKMIWHYDHRFGSYAGVDSRTSTQTPTPTLEQYQDPNYQILPWYWVEERLVKEQTDKKWFLGFRDVTNNTNERTFVTSIFPYNAANHKLQILISNLDVKNFICLTGMVSSFIFDFIARQKVGGTSMSYFNVKQFPFLIPANYSILEKIKIILKGLELIYTSWDIKSFADDVWKEADETLRAAIQQQWQENQAVTGGHPWQPPDWCEIDETGIPLPPFKWDEDRRAVLKAELDAIYAKLYGLTTEELRYILDPQDVYGPDFPGETFRVLKEKEIRKYGEYRTRRLVLEAWERMEGENR